MRICTLITLCGVLSACSDASLKTVNTAPTATITSHITGDVVTADAPFTLTGVASDADDGIDSLEASWLIESDVVCAAASPDSGGFSDCTLSLPEGETVVTLLVRDPSGTTGSDQIKLVAEPAPGDDTGEPGDDTGDPPGDDTGDPPGDDTGDPPENTAPTCAITAPLDGAVVAAGVSVDFLGVVADTEDGPEALTIAWLSDVDGTLSTGGAAAMGIVSLSTDALSVGTHTITLSATDTAGAACTAVVSVSINGQPTAPEVVIEPGPAYTDDDLVAVVVTPSTDPEGDAISYTFAWAVDGTPVATSSGTVSATDTSKGEIWSVMVTPSDGLSAGTAGEASREISNTPPQVDAASLSPDPAYTSDTLSAAVSVSDADGDPVTATYSWTVNGLVVSETGSTLSGIDFFDKHDEVGLTVMPTDTEEEGDALSAASLTILNTPPEAPEIAIEPEDPVPGIDALECVIVTESTDADEDDITYTTEWTVDGVSYTGPFGVSELGELWASSELPRTGAGYGIDWGDFDHDGDLDLAVANVGGVNQVYRNDGDTFTMVWTSPESETSMSAAWADWNGDGNLDVAFGGYWGAPTRIYEGDRSTFTLAWTSSSSAEVWDLSWGNLNGDDLPDLAISHETGRNRVYQNTGGDFDMVWESSDSAGTLGMAWGDWDGDGDDDLAVGNQKPCGTCSSGHSDQVYQNDGGSLSLAWTAGHADGTYSLAWGDWDGDGDLDLATAGNHGSTLRIYENVGGDLVAALNLDPGNTSSVDWGDWDGDGDDDLLSLTTGSAVLWDNDGGTLTEMWSDSSSHWGSGALADMDGDGDMDLVAGSGSGQPTTVWENLHCEDCVPGSETSTGEVWECTVTPDDGEDEGPPGTASVTLTEPVYSWAYMGTEDVEMVYGSCASTESYSATCAAALVGEQVFINESGGGALERKALGETHMGVEPGARGHTVSLSSDELEITWSGATGCGADWVRTDLVDVYECAAE